MFYSLANFIIWLADTKRRRAIRHTIKAFQKRSYSDIVSHGVICHARVRDESFTETIAKIKKIFKDTDIEVYKNHGGLCALFEMVVTKKDWNLGRIIAFCMFCESAVMTGIVKMKELEKFYEYILVHYK